MKKVIFFVAFVIITGFCFGQKLGVTKTITVQLVNIDCAGEYIGLYFKEKTSDRKYIFDWGRQGEYFDMKYKKYWENAFGNNGPCEVPKSKYYQCTLKYEIVERFMCDGDCPPKKVKDWVVIGLKKINR